jgi:hypothetical protein
MRKAVIIVDGIFIYLRLITNAYKLLKTFVCGINVHVDKNDRQPYDSTFKQNNATLERRIL